MVVLVVDKLHGYRNKTIIRANVSRANNVTNIVFSVL